MGNLIVGYGRVDITPGYPVPLRGYGNPARRLSNRNLDPIYVTCLAFSGEDGETVLLYSTDLTAPSLYCNREFRPAISASTGIPVDHILVAATHTHSAPDLNCDEVVGLSCYRERVKAALVEAAKSALADRERAVLSAAAVETEGLNFVRRYILADGTPAGDNYGHFDRSPIARHETEADRRLQLIRIGREGKRDILLANFQVHPHRTGGQKKLDISADIVGVMREKVERELGCLFAYFTGGAGNMNPTSRIKEENIYPDYRSHGLAMADYALKAEGTYGPVKAGDVGVRRTVKELEVDHTQDHLLGIAREIWEDYQRTEDRVTANDRSRENGMNSVYHAEAVIYKAEMPGSMQVELNAFSIGDAAFIVAPAELFDTTGRYIMDHSPFPVTFVVTCAHDSKDYIPDALGFANGGYSADTCRFLPGTAEKMARCYLDMLGQLWEER